MTPDLFLSPLISVVAKKAADSLIKQICSVIGVEKDREQLEIKLLVIQKKIADAEKQGANDELVMKFLEKLHAAAAEAENVLDDFQYEALRQKANSQYQQRCASAKVIMNFFTNENSVMFRCKMSKKLTKVLRKIHTIATEMNNFNFAPCDPEPSIDRETQSFVLDSEIIGRETERDKIVNILLDPQRERENISILSIVGMGGLGKTTLAQMVYNHEEVQKHFQLLLWVCVLIDFNVIDVIKSVIQVAQKGGVISESKKEVLQQKLREIFNSKRYLLVLDDVWNNEIEKWDELKSFLLSGASSGSVIIVTTRNKEVASIMETLPRYDLASLTEEDSWRLFEKRAFNAESSNPTEELIAIGKIIVRKCVGLPLVVKAMGGLMATKRKVSEWRAISENKILDSLQSTSNALPVLKLSYDNLTSHLKQCFSLCAIFPQDHEIEKETLIQLWIANDFIPNNGVMNLEDIGRDIFNELYSRSFFQDIREKETVNTQIPIITCKMHDLMHDLATQLAGKRCFATLKPNNPTITQKEVQPLKALQIPYFPSVRDLEYKRHVRYLEYMRHVRYLDLSDSFFKLLPETITTLYNLQTLKLSNSQICELPKGMRCLINLRHLFLDYCENLKCMPVGIGELTNLQTLTTYVAADLSRGRSIREISNLNLCGHLRLRGLESVRDGEDAKIVNLATKLNLCSVELEWSPKDIKERTSIDEIVIEALTPHNNLKYLRIFSYAGFRFPKWLKQSMVLDNLKKLWLFACINCVELPYVWQLPLLEELYLGTMASLKFIVPSTCWHADRTAPLENFPSLKILTMKNLPNLESWHEQDLEWATFPKLTLTDDSYPKLTIPMHVWQLPLLEELYLEDMKSLKFIVPGTCWHADRTAPLGNFPSLKILTMENLSNLESLHEQDLELTTFLKLVKLEIDSCPKLTIPMHVWQLPLLEELYLADMESLEFFVPGTCWHADRTAPLGNFPSLKILTMENLPNLKSLHEQDLELATFPKLVKLKIHSCPKLTIPMHAPLLVTLFVRDSDNIKLHQISNLPMLSYLDISAGEHRTGTDAFRPPKTLEEMAIYDFKNVNPFVDKENQNSQANSLRTLYIARSNCFFSCERSKSALGFWKHFASLIVLQIENCSKLVYWPYDEFKSLKCLEQLDISKCSHFTGSLPAQSLPTPHVEDFLPQLKSLQISKCPKLVELRSTSNSIKDLYISKCPELLCNGLAGLTNLTKLRNLHLGDCANLTALPDNMADLPVLEHLSIHNCPKIESFPHGIQLRLSSLQSIGLLGSPALTRRCRPGGDYWHLVSPIPTMITSVGDSLQFVGDNP